MFRSRDQGESWFSIDTGVFIGGALGLAVDPADRDHLLLATDSGLLRSMNGGRDWRQEAQAELNGPVFAVAFAASGKTAWAATTQHLLRFDAAQGWRSAQAPPQALPALAIAPAVQAARVYLASVDGFFVSADDGRNWQRAAGALPAGECTNFAITHAPREVLWLVVNAALWRSDDGAQRWHAVQGGLPAGTVAAVFAPRAASARLHALAQGRLYVSEDLGVRWQAQGAPLPDTHLAVRGLAASADGKVILVTTHKGLYRSVDAGATWALKEGNLPIHLEAGPLAVDPHDANTFYAGYALTPYGETWQRGLQARGQSQAVGDGSALLLWAGVAALLALAMAALGWLFAQRRAALAAAKEQLRREGGGET